MVDVREVRLLLFSYLYTDLRDLIAFRNLLYLNIFYRKVTENPRFLIYEVRVHWLIAFVVGLPIDSRKSPQSSLFGHSFDISIDSWSTDLGLMDADLLIDIIGWEMTTFTGIADDISILMLAHGVKVRMYVGIMRIFLGKARLIMRIILIICWHGQSVGYTESSSTFSPYSLWKPQINLSVHSIILSLHTEWLLRMRDSVTGMSSDRISKMIMNSSVKSMTNSLHQRISSLSVSGPSSSTRSRVSRISWRRQKSKNIHFPWRLARCRKICLPTMSISDERWGHLQNLPVQMLSHRISSSESVDRSISALGCSDPCSENNNENHSHFDLISENISLYFLRLFRASWNSQKIGLLHAAPWR